MLPQILAEISSPPYPGSAFTRMGALENVDAPWVYSPPGVGDPTVATKSCVGTTTHLRSEAAARTSRSSMRPSFPLPVSLFQSTPNSSATRLALGLMALLTPGEDSASATGREGVGIGTGAVGGETGAGVLAVP